MQNWLQGEIDVSGTGHFVQVVSKSSAIKQVSQWQCVNFESFRMLMSAEGNQAVKVVVLHALYHMWFLVY